jgi:ATP-dependent RNA helicase SUPV3L1/SUV3
MAVASEARPEATAAPAAAEVPAEPVEEEKPIMLWRPGRFGDRQRQENRGRGRRGQPREGQPREGQPDRPAGRSGEGGKGRFENRFKDKGDRPRGDRPDRGGPGGKPERDRGGKGDRNDRGDRGDRRPAAFQQKPREERPVKFDPDSPFAKLAALRDQLKK